MATLEDKILGEKLHNYCSSSEESDHESSDVEEADEKPSKSKSNPSGPPAVADVNKWEGTSTNTGPKGVITDWQKFKQLEFEKNRQSELEKIELAKKLTLTVQTALDEEREKAAREDPELAELLDDEFLMTYQKKRMQELLHQTNHNIQFGDLMFLRSGQEFLDAIDKEHKSVIIIVHVYENTLEACKTMNNCLRQLAKIYMNVKFCAIHGSCAGISDKFKSDGVPALLVYKAGSIIGNFIRVSDELGSNFLQEDVQAYLVEHGMLEDKSCTPELIKSANQDSDSD